MKNKNGPRPDTSVENTAYNLNGAINYYRHKISTSSVDTQLDKIRKHCLDLVMTIDMTHGFLLAVPYTKKKKRHHSAGQEFSSSAKRPRSKVTSTE